VGAVWESRTYGSVRGARGNSRPYRDMYFVAVHESAVNGYCCKSPKLPGANFIAVKKSDPRPPIDVASITLPRSPASLSSRNEVPHIFTRKSCVQPKEILITQQNRHSRDPSARHQGVCLPRCCGSEWPWCRTAALDPQRTLVLLTGLQNIRDTRLLCGRLRRRLRSRSKTARMRLGQHSCRSVVRARLRCDDGSLRQHDRARGQ
jgi:hypothetical protein